MKKRISYILLAVLLVLQLTGCGKDEKAPSGGSGAEGTEDAGGSNSQGGTWWELAEGMEDSALLGSGGKDNSLDAYSRISDTPLQVEQPPNAIEGGISKIFLGDSRAFYFKKHLFSSWKESWDELSFVTGEGETGAESFAWEQQIYEMGPVAGTDHYVAIGYDRQEEEEYEGLFLTERDENHEVVRRFPLHFLDGEDSTAALMSISALAMDRFGVTHLVRQTLEGQQYLLVSSEGEVLTEYITKNFRELIPLKDGRIAFLSLSRKSGEDEDPKIIMQYMDEETGEPVLLASPEKWINSFNLFDENTLLFADEEGVYRSDLSGNNQETLYRWRNHGITVNSVLDIQADAQGRISLIYESIENFSSVDLFSKKYGFLCLEPTVEEVEILNTTMLVDSFYYHYYEQLVVEFNKRYPAYHIELKSLDSSDSAETTALLTELTVGKGPVLIGTYGIPFKDYEELWEPLDAFAEQLGIADELFPCALDLGRINGKLYGIVMDFSIRTLVTGDLDLKDWDYATYLKCVEDNPKLEAVFDQYDGEFGEIFVMGFFNGLDDSYFLDGKEGTTNFDSSEFRKALELAKKYCVRKEAVDPGRSVLEGKVLCNRVSIGRPEQLALYRSCYGEDANYIGYPTKEGSAHFISGGCPLAIRRTATEEEKAAAGAFLRLCLSYEGQSFASKKTNFDLSVRKDVLEEQIAAMNERTTAYVSGFDQFVLGSALNIELDRKTLLDLIDKATISKGLPDELWDILYYELKAYFSGTITEDMLIDHLDNRVGLYLEEKN